MAALSGKRAVVVGAGSQHTKGLVAALAGAGANVTVIDASAESLVPYAPATRVCDMSEAGIIQTVQNLERDGGIDILVSTPAPIAEAPTGAGDATMGTIVDTVLQPALRWTSAVSKAMQARKTGVIVHVTGPSVLGGWPGWEAAGTAFAGIHNLVQSFAVEVAASGVRINALVPGVTSTQAQQIADATGQSLDAVTRRVPLGSFLPAESLGHALLYLVHPSSSYVSGEILSVDGGWGIWGRLHAVAS